MSDNLEHICMLFLRQEPFIIIKIVIYLLKSNVCTLNIVEIHTNARVLKKLNISSDYETILHYYYCNSTCLVLKCSIGMLTRLYVVYNLILYLISR